ncbi:MAG: Gldg family protein [Deltaproteobacteria bacterium]|nr:Gldg family protein [Deltaproteobacteria bacterium]
MSRGFILCGLVMLAFGAAAISGSRESTWFSQVNLIGGALLLAGALIHAISRARTAGAPAFRKPTLIAIGRVILALIAAFALERAANWSGVQLDWSFENKYEVAEALQVALDDLCEDYQLTAGLYFDSQDPRIRSTRVLLRTLGNVSCLEFDERNIDDHPEDEDRYAIGSSNTVVLVVRQNGQERYETVERPTQGALFEALFRLRQLQSGTVYVARGAGEGDFSDVGETGYSGLTAALQTEGYVVKEFVSAAAREIPADADVVLWVRPERRLPEPTLAALRRYLEKGGRLVAMLEPGVEGGLESVLEEWGLESIPGLVVDPASSELEGVAKGLAPLVYRYSPSHPVGRGLGGNRMTFFKGVGSFNLRKPQIGDRIRGIAFASPRSWITPDVEALRHSKAPAEPPDANRDYWPLVVTGSYMREARETRIVAFGDADIASNHYLRALYNLDLVVNAIHWAAEQTPRLTIRPKEGISGKMQFPLALQNTLTMYQSLGLLLPELLLLTAALLWARTR